MHIATDLSTIIAHCHKSLECDNCRSSQVYHHALYNKVTTRKICMKAKIYRNALYKVCFGSEKSCHHFGSKILPPTIIMRPD